MASVVMGERGFRSERFGDQVRLSVLWFAGNALWEALLSIILPIMVLADVGDARKAVALSLLSTVGTGLASLTHPLAGWASDATRSRLGRRRPYLMGGGLLSAVAVVWLAWGTGYGQLFAAVLMLQFGYNVAIAAYQAYIPEVAPAESRGRASGYLGLMQSVGALAGAIGAAFLVHGSTYRWMLLGLALLLVAGVAITVWGVPEGQPAPRPAASPAARPRGAYRDLWWAAITRGLVLLAFYTLLTYLAYYLKDVEHLTHYVQDTSYAVAVTITAAALATLWAGTRSDAIGRRAIVCAAGVLMGLGGAAFLAVHGLVGILAVGAAFGLGYGSYISVDWALVSDVLPDSSVVARDMGLWGLSTTLPQMVAPAIGGGIFLLLPGASAEGYRIVFGLTCLYAVAGSALVWKIRGAR
jgi:MFS family permease